MTPPDIAAFMAGTTGPIRLVNLLAFRTVAFYPNTRSPAIEGAAAYQLYLDTAYAKIASLGGEVLLDAPGRMLDAPENGPVWQRIIIVRYPSVQALAAMLADPEYLEAIIHRSAALEHNLTFAVTDQTGS